MKKQDEKVTTARVREFLEENTDPGYRKFHSSLLPGVDNIMGVRLPALRKFSQNLAKMQWQDWFAQADDQWYEETMLRGLTVAYSKLDCAEKRTYVERFVPDISNWAVCDCF